MSPMGTTSSISLIAEALSQYAEGSVEERLTAAFSGQSRLMPQLLLSLAEETMHRIEPYEVSL